jgi:predicted nuclease of predicted toxin-antitoxin system
VRFLVDNALSPVLARRLREGGHDATHVRDYGFAGAEDEVVMELARREVRIIVTADNDFAALLAQSGESRPSIVLFKRASPYDPHEQAGLLLAELTAFESELVSGCVLVLDETRLRVRLLPFGNSE